MDNTVLELVNKILEPKRLNYIQERVFVQSWSGKLYREIAIEAGYDFDYIKEVGAQVWQSLSDALGERVTKKNVKLILKNLYETHSLEQGQPPADAAIAVLNSDWMAFPNDAVPLYSSLYIDRPPIEERVYREITRPGSLIRIRAPRQMGKTSLLLRILAHSRSLGMRTVVINLQQADSRVFSDLNRFLRWLCTYITRQVDLDSKLTDYWDDEIGSKVSCTIYFQEYLLKHLSEPLVLALDEVNRLFEYPELAQEFLPLLRTWHEAAEQELWQKLRLVLVHATEVYIPLKLSQSPFNVGLQIQLPEFSLDQIKELAERYHLEQLGIGNTDLQALQALVGGHPFLIRLALHHLRQQEETFSRLLQDAPTQSGIYSDHLRQLWSVLQQHPELLTAVWQVVSSDSPVQLEAITAYRLESMGLIKLEGNEASPSCELYRLYFGAQLSSIEPVGSPDYH